MYRQQKSLYKCNLFPLTNEIECYIPLLTNEIESTDLNSTFVSSQWDPGKYWLTTLCQTAHVQTYCVLCWCRCPDRKKTPQHNNKVKQSHLYHLKNVHSCTKLCWWLSVEDKFLTVKDYWARMYHCSQWVGVLSLTVKPWLIKGAVYDATEKL